MIFLEIANRVGGADVVKTFELRTGLHLPTAELKLLLGEPFDIPNKRNVRNFYGWFVYPGHIIKSGQAEIFNTKEISQHEFIHEWVELEPGQPLAKKVSYQPYEVPLSGV